ncbi:MAG: diphosphate--fructose-6-phosphate 1-phosphotransferase [Candidatus Zhuqueibacterota bacterium]
MNSTTMGSRGTLGILVGGGPAPGINGVIAAATIEAENAGLRVVGIMDGFEWLQQGNTEHITELEISNVSRIHFTGGSILRTSRANPTTSSLLLENTVKAIQQLGLNYLITIGGDDTIFAVHQLNKIIGHELKIAHVPKTIDNDLPLPNKIPTFGYETARHVGVTLVQNIMEDSRTSNRWYIIVTMGLKAGHLTLGICKAAGATLAIIREEFPEPHVTLGHVCDVIEGAMMKRKTMGRNDGVALIAEGIATKFSEEELRRIPGVIIKHDDYGNIRMSEIELGKIIKLELERRFARRDEKIHLVEINIGYELRCAPPIPFDCEYVRDLGYSAMQFLLNEKYDNLNAALICVDAGKLAPIPIDSLIDPKTGKTRLRYVDTTTDSYAVAQEYMIKLKKANFDEPDDLSKLAKVAKMTPEAFRNKFGYLAR